MSHAGAAPPAGDFGFGLIISDKKNPWNQEWVSLFIC